MAGSRPEDRQAAKEAKKKATKKAKQKKAMAADLEKCKAEYAKQGGKKVLS